VSPAAPHSSTLVKEAVVDEPDGVATGV
jgi:hypothetical protein